MVSVSSGTEQTDTDAARRADGYLKAVRSGEKEQVWRWIAKNETGKLDETAAFAALLLAGEMLCGRASAGNLSTPQLMALYRLLERCADYLKVNVNAKHVFSLLAAHASLEEL